MIHRHSVNRRINGLISIKMEISIAVQDNIKIRRATTPLYTSRQSKAQNSYYLKGFHNYCSFKSKIVLYLSEQNVQERSLKLACWRTGTGMFTESDKIFFLSPQRQTKIINVHNFFPLRNTTILAAFQPLVLHRSYSRILSELLFIWYNSK